MTTYPPPASTPAEPEQQVTTPTRKRRRWPWIVGIVTALILGYAAGATGDEPEVADADGGNNPQPAPTVTVTAEPTDLDEREALLDELQTELDEYSTALDEKAEALDQRSTNLDEREDELVATETEIADNTIPGDGTWIVGDDIEPGTYRSDGGDLCYWARLSSTSGEFDAIIANDVPSGPSTVTIAESDAAFETEGCADWTRQ